MLSSSSRHTKSRWWNQSWPKPLWTETESSPEWMIIKSTRKTVSLWWCVGKQSLKITGFLMRCSLTFHWSFFFHLALKDEDGMWSLLWGWIQKDFLSLGQATFSQPSFFRPLCHLTLHHILAHRMQNAQLNSCINSDSTVRSEHIYPGGKLRL